MARWIDRGALVVSIAFLAAAVLLGLVWASDARASVNRVVLTKRATSVVFVAQRKIWRHNLPRARSFSIRCGFERLRGHGARRRGVITDCTFRAYRHTNFTGRLLVFPLDVTAVPPPPAGLGGPLFEDGSGWARYDATRSLYMNPRSPHLIRVRLRAMPRYIGG
jgi:hypothetical protein